MSPGRNDSERAAIAGWMETAKRACEHGVAMEPTVRFHIFLGVINETMGNLDESVKVYDRAFEALPDDAPDLLLFRATNSR